jgi:hypothetical protein
MIRNCSLIAAGTNDRHHLYEFPVFNFVELDALIRSLPLRVGYEALLPLYSEGDEAAEVDSVRVEALTPGVWRVRFADPAIVATIQLDGNSRTQLAYSHVFRRNGSTWKAGTVWRRMSVACQTGAR